MFVIKEFQTTCTYTLEGAVCDIHARNQTLPSQTNKNKFTVHADNRYQVNFSYNANGSKLLIVCPKN